MKKDEMIDDMALLLREQPREAALTELRRCNEQTARYGLMLTEAQMRELLAERETALRATGRMEFGGGILPALIAAFADSPCLQPADYGAVLADLQEAFYYFKGEAMERLDDAELLALMRQAFDGPAQGSAEYLAGATLEELCRRLRQGGVR